MRGCTEYGGNGDIPELLANGDGAEGLRWRRRAGRSFGPAGTGEVGGTPAHGGLSLRPQGRARFENFRTEIFRGRSSEADRLNICRNGCAERQRGGGRALPPRRAPFGRKESPPWAGVPPDAVSSPLARKTVPHASAATIRSFGPRCRAITHVPEVEKIARLGVLVLAEPFESCTLFPAAANGAVPLWLARGDRAVRVGAPSEG